MAFDPYHAHGRRRRVVEPRRVAPWEIGGRRLGQLQGAASWQTPPKQVCSAAQLFSQCPQCSALLSTDTSLPSTEL
jgi:hypothetical protein